MPRVAKPKQRLDEVLVARGLAESRSQARGLIMAGQVHVDGRMVDKAGAPTSPQAVVHVDRGLPYVSRGGLKLEHALDHFGLDVTGQPALDVGASTGGFTDCLLQRGAARVYALDGGRGQLHHRLRQDSRVRVMERVNARHPFSLPEPVRLATIDVSFISLTLVIPSVVVHLASGGRLLCLAKPQFEARREQVPRGGVVRDPSVHGEVLAKLVVWTVGQGLRLRGVTASPLRGDKGNREFFLLLQKP
ncbi:MAG: TlyA family RNA methyltransferase [Dehalococcoidia bacterium]